MSAVPRGLTENSRSSTMTPGRRSADGLERLQRLVIREGDQLAAQFAGAFLQRRQQVGGANQDGTGLGHNRSVCERARELG